MLHNPFKKLICPTYILHTLSKSNFLQTPFVILFNPLRYLKVSQWLIHVLLGLGGHLVNSPIQGSGWALIGLVGNPKFLTPAPAVFPIGKKWGPMNLNEANNTSRSERCPMAKNYLRWLQNRCQHIGNATTKAATIHNPTSVWGCLNLNINQKKDWTLLSVFVRSQICIEFELFLNFKLI